MTDNEHTQRPELIRSRRTKQIEDRAASSSVHKADERKFLEFNMAMDEMAQTSTIWESLDAACPSRQMTERQTKLKASFSQQMAIAIVETARTISDLGFFGNVCKLRDDLNEKLELLDGGKPISVRRETVENESFLLGLLLQVHDGASQDVIEREFIEWHFLEAPFKAISDLWGNLRNLDEYLPWRPRFRAFEEKVRIGRGFDDPGKRSICFSEVVSTYSDLELLPRVPNHFVGTPAANVFVELVSYLYVDALPATENELLKTWISDGMPIEEIPSIRMLERSLVQFVELSRLATPTSKIDKFHQVSAEETSANSRVDSDSVKESNEAPAMSVREDDAFPYARLLSAFTGGVSDDRFGKAVVLLQNNSLSIDERLTRIDAIIPFPANTSAAVLGKLFGVTKQSIFKTSWWLMHRKGSKDDDFGRRQGNYLERAKQHESSQVNVD